jgi:hypothetical protein
MREGWSESLGRLSQDSSSVPDRRLHVSERSRSHSSRVDAVISDEMRSCSLARVMGSRGGPEDSAAVAVLLHNDCVLWTVCGESIALRFPQWAFVRRFVWSILGESFGCDVP